MLKCIICYQTLTGALESAKNKRQESYVMCPECGYVHLLARENGLPVLKRTKEGHEALEQMREAKMLFEKNDIAINGFKASIHGDIQSTENLKTEEEKFEDRYQHFMDNLCEEQKELLDEAIVIAEELGKALGFSDEQIAERIETSKRMAFIKYEKDHPEEFEEEDEENPCEDCYEDDCDGCYYNEDEEYDEIEDECEECDGCCCDSKEKQEEVIEFLNSIGIPKHITEALISSEDEEEAQENEYPEYVIFCEDKFTLVDETTAKEIISNSGDEIKKIFKLVEVQPKVKTEIDLV